MIDETTLTEQLARLSPAAFRAVCNRLEIPYGVIHGTTQERSIAALIAYARRRRMLSALAEAIGDDTPPQSSGMVVHGDYVAGSKHTVDTQGGDYAEGTITK